MADRGVHWEADQCQALTSFCCGIIILNVTIKNTYLISLAYSFGTDSSSDLEEIRNLISPVSAKEIGRK